MRSAAEASRSRQASCVRRRRRSPAETRARGSLGRVPVLAAWIDTAWGVFGVVAGFACIVALVWVGATGQRDRDAEDAARAFFDRHGYWPDDDPGR